MTETLPEGHPLPWDELVPYEKDQGGYWLYPAGCDVYGNGKVFVRVPHPEQPGEVRRFVSEVQHLAQLVDSRARDTGNADMARLAGELKQVWARNLPAPEKAART